MGWSCSALASDTMERLFSLHNNKGVIEYKGERYFLEVSNREYADGRVVIQVWRIVSATPNLSHGICERKGSFSIKPDGTIPKWVFKRFPFLKRVEDT